MSKYYVNENWPTSNSNPDVFYILSIEGMKPRHYYTVDDLETAICQAHNNNRLIKKAVRMENGLPREFVPETSTEKSARENRAHCKHIAKKVEAYTEGRVYRCPDCDEIHVFPDTVGDKFKCPDCGSVNDISYWEPLTLWDFVSDALNIEYRMSSKTELNSVQIMVACGGPNIYIDTATKNVELYWWNERATYPISYDAANALDEWAGEMWDCQ